MNLNLRDIGKSASEFGAAFELPPFEIEPEAIRSSVKEAISRADSAMDELAALDHSTRNFENTAAAFDRLLCDSGVVASRIYLLKEVHPDSSIREAATEAIKEFQQWAVGIDYREDVYEAFKAYVDSQPELEGEALRFVGDVMRDYRRSGMSLPPADRSRVEALRKELADLETDFRSNITAAKAELEFTAEELAGVPESFLNSPGIRTEKGTYVVQANITWHAMMVMDYARSEETRRRFNETRLRLCREENGPILNRILLLRQDIASILGYDSWADYRTEVRMAGTSSAVHSFLNELRNGLRQKFLGEIESFRKIKAESTGNPGAEIHLHDFRFYQNLYKKQAFQVDDEELRNFFPYDRVLQGMFDIFGLVFGIRLERVDPPVKWVDDLELYMVRDEESGRPLGAMYLDMFPREGKFNHFAQFGLIPGHRRRDGLYQCPVVALICNFALPEEGKPSLLTHNEVETLFHEFGHAMHSILTQAETNHFSGTSVDHDFVEVPSQILEFWAWDKAVLDRFARDHRDDTRTIPADLLDKMKDASKAVKGTHYTRQVAFSLLDMNLHRHRNRDETVDAIDEANAILNDVFLPQPEGGAFAAYFGHLSGYDAGYYSYAWADAIAADLDTVFRDSSKRYLNPGDGRRLRESIFAPGGSRDPNELVKEFLGRSSSLKPFLESIGAAADN